MEAARPIRPEVLASKIEKIDNFEQFRLLEEFSSDRRLVRLLWFLQYVSQPSNYAGGLTKFAHDLVAASADKIGTARMVKIGRVKHYELRDATKIFSELSATSRNELFDSNTSLFEEAFLHGKHDKPCKLGEWRKDWEKQFLSEVTPANVRRLCVDAARHDLARYFSDLCELPHIGLRPHSEHGAPWYFVNVADALLEFADALAKSIRSRIAETEVTREVSRWIRKSRSMRKSVMITGNSRFGKTEAVKAEVATAPGDCRLVNTPATNSITDLLREVAKSLGLEIGAQNSAQSLRDRIDYVLRFSRLQLIFDESQFLLPSSFSRNTAPARLNWVRRSIMDQSIAAVFVCTPQSYLPAKRRFVNATGFVMEQFDERVLNRELPNELSEADLLEVARVHFSGLAEDYLHYVVDKALATERNFVSDIEKIATLAKDNAREHGRKAPILADIENAIADVLPTPPKVLQPAAKKTRSATPVRRPCKRVAEPPPRRGIDQQPEPIRTRENRPALTTV